MDGPGGDADELVNVYIESAALHALLHESATLHHYTMTCVTLHTVPK